MSGDRHQRIYEFQEWLKKQGFSERCGPGYVFEVKDVVMHQNYVDRNQPMYTQYGAYGGVSNTRQATPGWTVVIEGNGYNEEYAGPAFESFQEANAYAEHVKKRWADASAVTEINVAGAARAMINAKVEEKNDSQYAWQPRVNNALAASIHAWKHDKLEEATSYYCKDPYNGRGCGFCEGCCISAYFLEHMTEGPE